MKNIKFPNFFFSVIAIILGASLYRHFDFKNLRFEKPALDILYLIVFIISIYLMIKDYKKRPEE